MKRRGMTRLQLSRELGINETTLGRWLKGRSDPGMGVVRHIGAILGLSLVGTGPADGDHAEERELLEAFRRMPAAERRLLLQCLRERDLPWHPVTPDGEDRPMG